MKVLFRPLAAALVCLGLATACTKDNTSPAEPPPAEDGSTITAIGSPAGTAVKKIIGANGGQLASADGRMQVTIPAGALTADKEISIQAISNELPDGIGNGYRLLPHGEQFSKPVSISFTYKNEDLQGTLPEFLDVAFQGQDGSWEAITHPSLDKGNKKVTVTTTHFSDWTFFKSLMLVPYEATVVLNGELELKVITHFPYVDPDDAAPGTDPVKVLKNPRELRPHEIKGWSYAGEGILVSRVSKAYYTAPSKEPDANPEAVVANIKLARKGQFMLVSNITVLPKYVVRYLQVDEDYKSPANNGNCTLYLYGSFGNDPGAGKRSVKIAGTAVMADLWAPTLIRCRIDRDISGEIVISADGKIVTKSELKKYTGVFIYNRYHGGVINAGSPNALKETTEFNIVYRGFGAAMPTEITNPFLTQGIGAYGTRADYTLGGSASVTTPTLCPATNSVTIPATSGSAIMNTIDIHDGRFDCNIKEKASGIEMMLNFSVLNVVENVKVHYADCNWSGYLPAKTAGVSLEGFNNTAIALSFSGTNKLIIPGTGELKSGRLSSGILIEAWDGTGSPSHYETDGLVAATLKNK